MPVTRISFGRSGVFTWSGGPDEPVDVTRLAAEVGIACRVFFAPEVWAYCEPEAPHADELMNQAERDQRARHILVGLARNISKFQGGRLLFRSNGARRQAMLAAEAYDDGYQAEITVKIAVK